MMMSLHSLHTFLVGDFDSIVSGCIVDIKDVVLSLAPPGALTARTARRIRVALLETAHPTLILRNEFLRE